MQHCRYLHLVAFSSTFHVCVPLCAWDALFLPLIGRIFRCKSRAITLRIWPFVLSRSSCSVVVAAKNTSDAKENDTKLTSLLSGSTTEDAHVDWSGEGHSHSLLLAADVHAADHLLPFGWREKNRVISELRFAGTNLSGWFDTNHVPRPNNQR